MKLLLPELRSWHPQEKAWICPADALEEIKSHWRRPDVKIKIRATNPTPVSVTFAPFQSCCSHVLSHHATRSGAASQAAAPY